MFVGNGPMARLNNLYRGKKGPTDVLSFPMDPFSAAPPCPVLGDIVICVPKALSQSVEYNVSLYDELLRLMVHGLLHLIGYDHEKNAYQKKKMQNKEQELINAVSSMD